ncbi:hypothetical protein ABVT39_012914 [Epinephelus coioides]
MHTFSVDDPQTEATTSKTKYTTSLVHRVDPPRQIRTFNYAQNQQEGLVRRSKAQLQICRLTKSMLISETRKLGNISLKQMRKCYKIEKEVVHLRRELGTLQAKYDRDIGLLHTKFDDILKKLSP